MMQFDIPWCDDSRYLLMATNGWDGERMVLDCAKTARVARSKLRQTRNRRGVNRFAAFAHDKLSIFKI